MDDLKEAAYPGLQIQISWSNTAQHPDSGTLLRYIPPAASAAYTPHKGRFVNSYSMKNNSMTGSSQSRCRCGLLMISSTGHS